MDQTLHIRIITPRELMLDIAAESISSKNSQGTFDILPQHANFITLIENSPITVRVKGQKALTFKFPLAIMNVSENKVDIYTYVQPQLDKE